VARHAAAGLFGGAAREGAPGRDGGDGSRRRRTARRLDLPRPAHAAVHGLRGRPARAEPLFGYAGLVSFGHALFVGSVAYTERSLTSHGKIRSLE